MLRSVLAVLGGMVAAGVAMMGLEWVGREILPPPPGMDLGDPVAMASLTQDLPLEMLLTLLFAWALATLIGALAACFIAGEHPLVNSILIGLIVSAVTAVNLARFPHPGWFSISAYVLIACSALLAGRISSAR